MNIPVLCIAQVIGASRSTTTKKKFKHPYILIRDDEVPRFYTPTFAPALRFVRQRHTLVKYVRFIVLLWNPDQVEKKESVGTGVHVLVNRLCVCARVALKIYKFFFKVGIIVAFCFWQK